MSFWEVLPVAVALTLVMEGILPFLSPGLWRSVMSQVASLDDASVRRFGLGSMLLGITVLYVAN
ncbi:MAG: DUF2065 family protein [Pseudomonadota bacterium]